MKILGIETSCDETAAAIVKDGRQVLSSQIFSQTFKHQKWGGVIPEFASRMHLEIIHEIIHQALEKANLNFQQIDAIAVTQGPGLMGSLMVGLNVAKLLAWIYRKTLIPVNHLYGHVCANFLGTQLEPPFICLLASGGHTQLIHLQNYCDMKILGSSLDDAAGEAFDKVARLMQLKYPGGPELDALAQTVTNKEASCEIESISIVNGQYKFPIAQTQNYDFSFSGLKTSVLRLKEKLGEEIFMQERSKIAKAFQECIAYSLLNKTLKASRELGLSKIVLAGGVAANSSIRALFQENFENIFLPSLEFCGDNAAMIASAAYFCPQPGDYSLEAFARFQNS